MSCISCCAPACGTCIECMDKLRFGGLAKRKKACLMRRRCDSKLLFDVVRAMHVNVMACQIHEEMRASERHVALRSCEDA